MHWRVTHDADCQGQGGPAKYFLSQPNIFWAMGEKSIQNMVDIKVEGHTSSVISAFEVVPLNHIWKDKIFTVYERDAIRTNLTSESNPLVGAAC